MLPPHSTACLPPAQNRRLATLASAMLTLISLLVLPLVVLLFSQWPLRELLKMYSQRANDLGQTCFAIYVAVAVTAASRAGVHLSSLRQVEAKAPHIHWRTWATAACTAPWAAFMVWSGWPVMIQSALSLEHFGETQSPGYFIIKLAMILMVLMVLLDSVLELSRSRRPESRL